MEIKILHFGLVLAVLLVTFSHTTAECINLLPCLLKPGADHVKCFDECSTVKEKRAVSCSAKCNGISNYSLCLHICRSRFNTRPV